MPGIATVKMTPGEILLRIVPKREFEAAPENALVKGVASGLAGWTSWQRNPCLITIPEGWEIDSLPDRGYADWRSYDNSNTLAHEILHCLRGAWHPPWQDILVYRLTAANGGNP